MHVGSFRGYFMLLGQQFKTVVRSYKQVELNSNSVMELRTTVFKHHSLIIKRTALNSSLWPNWQTDAWLF